MENQWLKDGLDKIDSKIDKLDERLDNVDVTLGKQSIILEDHTRRSLANEEQVELLKKKLEEDVKPLRNHVLMVNTVFKIIGVVASSVGVFSGVLRLIEFFVH